MRWLCTAPLAAMAMNPQDDTTMLSLPQDDSTLLSLRASSKSAALMQDFAHRNVTHLEGLMQSMVTDSISGDGTASDDMQGLLNNIKELLLGDIRGVLQDEHNLDQASIYDLKSCFHDCQNGFNDDRRGDSELKDRADAEQRNHEACRTEVHAAYVAKVKKCNSLDAFIESLVFPSGYKEKCEPLSTKMGEVFEEGIAWYTRNFESWRVLHESCVAAYHKYDALDTGCDMTQGAFETSTCAHVQSMWTSCSVNQKACCARCSARFHNEVSRVECSERDRKIDWSATEKIECYVDILLNSPTDEELKARCTDGENCLSNWRQSEYDKCNKVCAEVDFEYTNYRHVGADASAEDDWQEGDTADEVNTTHRKTSNTVGEALGSGAHQSYEAGGVSWDGDGLQGARCTRHLDIDFIQMPPCESCPPLPPTPCSGDFITKYYFEYDKSDRITTLSTEKECSPDVHTRVWGYNRAVCRECGPLVGREVKVDEWAYFEVEIGKNTEHHGKKCVNLHYPVVCESGAGNPGTRVNADWADAPDTFMITVEGADSKRVCAERTDAMTGHDVAIEGADETHYEQSNQVGFIWGMNLRIQCKAIHAQPTGISANSEADSFTHIFRYSGGSGPMSVFRPHKGGFCSLGDIILNDYSTTAPSGTKASFVPKSVGKHPVDFEWVGAENQEGGVNWWKPLCSAGFVPAGHVAVQAPERSPNKKPSADSVCCIPRDMVCEYQNAEGTDGRIWSDSGTGGMDNCQWRRKGLRTFVADVSNCEGRFSPPCTSYFSACPTPPPGPVDGPVDVSNALVCGSKPAMLDAGWTWTGCTTNHHGGDSLCNGIWCHSQEQMRLKVPMTGGPSWCTATWMNNYGNSDANGFVRLMKNGVQLGEAKANQQKSVSFEYLPGDELEIWEGFAIAKANPNWLQCGPKPEDNCGGLDGGSWNLVRHVPAGNHWHPAKDQLRGTEVYGNPDGPLSGHAWSTDFSDTPFTEFLFATGDCEHWLIATKESVMGIYANQQRPIKLSSKNDNPSTAAWYRRSGNVEDPWISTIDHGPAISAGEIVYGENNFGSTHAHAVLPKHDGANVFIRDLGMVDNL